MKRILVFLGIFMMSISSVCNAQEKAKEPVYTDAAQFPLYGKVTENTSERYGRLPQSFEGVVRKPIWRLGSNSAGLFIRFRTNSTSVHLRWTPKRDYTMTHMTDTGTKGLDLYCLTEDGWRYVRCGKPNGKTSTMKAIENMTKEDREFMLYLSLYDGVSSLEIGVDPDAYIEQPQVDSPRTGNPIVMYGTSILQGGCANRPGMAHTNILGRWLDREIINLGFSGNAYLDVEIAEYIATVENPSLIVLDYAPNCTAEMIDEKAEKFFRIVRDAHPDVPVIIVESPMYAHAMFDTKAHDVIVRKNEAQERLYKKLKKAGEKKLYYVDSKGMIGDDMEATVDGTHFTDLGMMRYAKHIFPTMKKALGRK